MIHRFPTCLLPAAWAALLAGALAACASTPAPTGNPPPPLRVQILALNDFHGALEAPALPTRFDEDGTLREAPLGGAARLAATLEQLRARQAHTITVAAGDMIGASPLVSSYFLDEPTIMALNRMGMDLVAVGNHEFDRGVPELRRMQAGGCAQHTSREPCLIDRPFEGARFSFLAANVLDDAGQTLFPGTAMRRFGNVSIGFIGMTLKETATLTSPAGTTGFSFADEAETANRLASQLLGEGADLLVLLIHQGGNVSPINNVAGCPGLEGDILPILERLDPAIRVVISGHTHQAYACELPASDGTKRLLTSAGRYGQMVTEIGLVFDAGERRLQAMSARNRLVLAEAGEQVEVAQLVGRYVAAAADVANAPVGRLIGPLQRASGLPETTLANLVADAQLAAARDPARGGAQMAFINSGGLRTAFEPAADGSVTYGQLFGLQPFGNSVVVVELSGAQLKALLEQQFQPETGALRPSVLLPSQGFTYAFDRSRPAGERIVAMRLNGAPIMPTASYRVAVNNFLASGGDGYSLLADRPILADAGEDLAALVAWLAPGREAPALGRIEDRTPTR